MPKGTIRFADHPLTLFFGIFPGPVRSRPKAWLMTALFFGLLYGICFVAMGARHVHRHPGSAGPMTLTFVALEAAFLYCPLLLALSFVIIPWQTSRRFRWLRQRVEFPIEAKLKRLSPDNPDALAAAHDLQMTFYEIGQLDWPYQGVDSSDEIPPYVRMIDRIELMLTELQMRIEEEERTGIPDETLGARIQYAQAAASELPEDLGLLIWSRLCYHFGAASEIAMWALLASLFAINIWVGLVISFFVGMSYVAQFFDAIDPLPTG